MAYVVDRCPMCAAPLTSDAPVQICQYCGARLLKNGGQYQTEGLNGGPVPVPAVQDARGFVPPAEAPTTATQTGGGWVGWPSAVVFGLAFGVMAIWALLALAAEGLAINVWPTLVAYLVVPALILVPRLVQRRGQDGTPSQRTGSSSVGLFLLVLVWCAAAFIVFFFFLGEKTGPTLGAAIAYVLLVLAPGVWLREKLLPPHRVL